MPQTLNPPGTARGRERVHSRATREHAGGFVGGKARRGFDKTSADMSIPGELGLGGVVKRRGAGFCERAQKENVEHREFVKE